MSLYDIYQPSWSHFNNSNPFFMEDDGDKYGFSPLFSATEDSLDISSSMTCFGTISSDHNYMEFPLLVDEVHENSSTQGFQIDFDEFDQIFNDNFDYMPKSLNETKEGGGQSSAPQQSATDEFSELWNLDNALNASEEAMDMTISMQPPSSLILPFPGMEIDNQLCLVHLLMAYAEAIENQENELSKVIVQNIIKKVNPVGGIVERVLYYMFHDDKQSGYLFEESIKNFYPAFKAFYQIFPYGKFAHSVANLAIQESMPSDADVIQIFDFDIGEGIQWALLLESIKYQCKEIRITTVKFGKDNEFTPFTWNFEETKSRLCDHARLNGLKMKIQEVELKDLGSEIKNMEKEYYGRKSWYAFNCMVGLPHMGRVRNKKDAMEFLKVAKDFLHIVSNCYTNSISKGIIIYGDGYACHNLTSASSYSTFLDTNFARFQALLETMEFNFPIHLGEARIALECLFVAPYVSSITLERKWKEKKQLGDCHQFGLGLKEQKLSEKSLLEAREMVKEGDNLYGVRFESENNNVIVMDWRDIPLLRVCCWKG